MDYVNIVKVLNSVTASGAIEYETVYLAVAQALSTIPIRPVTLPSYPMA